MKRLLLTAFAICLVASTSTSASAEVRNHDKAKVSIDVPTGWKIDAGEDHMTIMDPKEEVAFFMMVMEADDLDEAAKALDSEVNKAVKSVKWEGEPSELKLNGMDAIAVEGAGKIDGQAVDLGVLIVVTPAHKALLVLGAVESSKSKAHEKDVEKLLNSIKPLK
jgi:predicted Zn-dependent protease